MIKRVLNSITVRYRRLILRFKFYLGLRRKSNLNIKILPWSNFAGVPGNTEYLPNGNKIKEQKEPLSNVEDLLNHRFEIYGKKFQCRDAGNS